VFDGGAGSGEYLRRLLASGKATNVIALEFDKHNYTRLEENLGGRAEARLIPGSLLSVPVADASADVVMSTQVLEHIEDHQQAASELNRILKPGGYAVITTPHPPEPFPNPDHAREGYTEDDHRALFHPYGWQHLWTDYFLTQSTVEAMMEADRMPLHGVYLPVHSVDHEAELSWEERRDQCPFGILGLFQKPAETA
jgi:SAM-dependent methyltransferase